MVHESPLRKRLATWQTARRPDPRLAAQRPGAATGMQAAPAPIEYLAYGPDDARASREIVATFGDLESEYAALRRGAGLLDAPHRGTILVTGGERRPLLDRMLTQNLADLEPGAARESFWLNRRGRIVSDLLVAALGDRILIDVDVHAAETTRASLEEFVFAEDVAIADATAAHHHVSIHGPQAIEVLAAAAGSAPELDDLACAAVTVAGADVVAIRRDQAGVTGLELVLPRDRAEAVWDALLGAGGKAAPGPRRVRPIGWHAFNIARIEAGTPLFNVDFGTTNLPHETGVIGRRVSFSKGCYLGQEIVARTENLGRPKQTLIGLRPEGERLPAAGAAVHAPDEAGDVGPQIGVVTSSTPSPLLGSAPIAFAMIKTSHADAGTGVFVEAEGERVAATVGGLRFVAPGEQP